MRYIFNGLSFNGLGWLRGANLLFVGSLLLVTVFVIPAAQAQSKYEGAWQWNSGLGPAILTVTDVDGSGKAAGSYALVEHPQHTSTFHSDDGSSAQLDGDQLKVKLKSGSTFELSRDGDELVGDFTFSRSGEVHQVRFFRTK